MEDSDTRQVILLPDHLEEDLTPAERAYNRLKKNVSKYQKAHPEKCKEKNKKYLVNLKENNPDKYNEYLQKKKEYYNTVVKPRNDAKKKD